MTTNWTPIPKASGTTYITVFPTGKESWDDPSVAWDSSTTAWDGNASSWTNIAKPAPAIDLSTWNSLGTLRWEDLGSLTWQGNSTWTNIPKAT